MSTTSQIETLATTIGADIKALLEKIGDLTALDSTEKSNLVGALNETIAQIAGAGGASIDDAATGAGAAWSAQRVIAYVTGVRDDLVDGAPGVLDTINEIAAALGDNPDAVSALETLAANNATAISTLAANVGDTSTNFVTTYTTARDAA